jgi:hypothetical protein
MNLDLLGGVAKCLEQLVGYRFSVLNREIAAGDLRSARRGAVPGLCRNDIARSTFFGARCGTSQLRKIMAQVSSRVIGDIYSPPTTR